jgi:hypothetical protein
MKVTRLNSDKLVTLNIRKYLIDWENDGNSSLEVRFRDLIYLYWRNSIILFQPTIPGSLLKLDYLNVNKRLCVELDGPQHNKFNKFFHNNSRNIYLAAIKNDMKKEKWLERNKITLLRLNEHDLDYFSPKYIENSYGINII